MAVSLRLSLTPAAYVTTKGVAGWVQPQQQLLLTRRCLATSPCWHGLVSGFRDKFLKEEDYHKRPSDLEIKKKGLPSNTPTLIQKAKRDKSTNFFVTDRKSGYHMGETGTVTDYIDREMTIREMYHDSVQGIRMELNRAVEKAKNFKAGIF